MDKAIKISNWIFNYAQAAGIKSLVVGISGGVDSALVSTLCAMTGLPTYCVVINIGKESSFAESHIISLSERCKNVSGHIIDLTECFDKFERIMFMNYDNGLGFANSKARLRMITLYQIATSKNGLVVGTGNKIEDFGIGFFTKYGDGGVDISPIADLYKSEVFAMAKELGVIEEILNAKPTDGLWNDGRTDEDQIGCTYDELEEVMEGTSTNKKAIEIYNDFHNKNLHKFNPIPVCKI